LCKTVEPGTEIGMEACSGAHYWARLLSQRGYEVKIIAPQFVKPFVKSNKNDANVVAVAMANKIARMAWAMITRGTDYDPEFNPVIAK